ncbi:LOW QUALITY PROTEIN: hypothetical protein AQUCO_01100029v1 [Aquilegia coerulea]|uniref:Uncharacterized protein n=1 Tax=Aquilegia coerulea TaxID=218851 RepID=A0A2G5E582_AQUCA|nr:LOW QUALITY PROTEIN: hypothetical protein AQUCO_01100029v1 [Aquilegia coerulea]
MIHWATKGQLLNRETGRKCCPMLFMLQTYRRFILIWKGNGSVSMYPVLHNQTFVLVGHSFLLPSNVSFEEYHRNLKQILCRCVPHC